MRDEDEHVDVHGYMGIYVTVIYIGIYDLRCTYLHSIHPFPSTLST
jgi:hypothetical protein